MLDLEPLMYHVVVDVDYKPPSTIIHIDQKIIRQEAVSCDQGVVLKIGPTAYKDYNIECPIKVGDVVKFKTHTGQVYYDKEANRFLRVLNDQDIIAIVNGDNN